MATVKKQKGILLIGKEKLDCYIAMSAGVLSLPFPPNIIRSMDVIDKVALQTYIHTFVTTNKIIPGVLSIIIHDSLLFEKLLPGSVKNTIPVATPLAAPSPQTPQPVTIPVAIPAQPIVLSASGKVVKSTSQESKADEEELIQQFIDSVPFEEVFVKTLKTTDGKLIIVANKDLVISIKDAFTKEGFEIDTVYPITVFGKQTIAASGLTTQSAQLLLNKQETQHSQNMLERPLDTQVGPVAMGMPRKESDKKRLYLMIGVFVLLIGVLIYFALRMNAENAQIPQAATVATEVPLQPDVPTPTVPVIASSSADLKQTISITIAFSQKRASQSAIVQTGLQSKGYQNIFIQPGSTQNNTPFVTFTSEVPEDIRNELLLTLLELDGTTTLQENSGLGSTIVISY